MKDDQNRILMLAGQLPARLTTEKQHMGFELPAHDVPVLVAARC